MSPAGAAVTAATAGCARDTFLPDVRVADLVAGAFAAAFFVAGAVEAEGLRADFLVAVAVVVDGEAVLLTAAFFRVVVEMVFAAFGFVAAEVRAEVVAFRAARVVGAFLACLDGAALAAFGGADDAARLRGVLVADVVAFGRPSFAAARFDAGGFGAVFLEAALLDTVLRWLADRVPDVVEPRPR